MQVAKRPATLRRCSTSRNTSRPPSDERWPPSKRAITGLPPTGDRPGSAGVDSTLAGMVLRIRRIGLENQILRWIKGLYYARQPSRIIQARNSPRTYYQVNVPRKYS